MSDLFNLVTALSSDNIINCIMTQFFKYKFLTLSSHSWNGILIWATINWILAKLIDHSTGDI